MSIRNDRTGRHEDDLYDELRREGAVTLEHLIEHLNECIVEVPEAFGSNVCAPVKMASMILESLVKEGILNKDGMITL
jgi:hypothetical protein